MEIKSFFYGLRNQEETEKEINDFLADKNIRVEKIFQSTASVSCSFDRPEFRDVCVVITVAYSKK